MIKSDPHVFHLAVKGVPVLASCWVIEFCLFFNNAEGILDFHDKGLEFLGLSDRTIESMNSEER